MGDVGRDELGPRPIAIVPRWDHRTQPGWVGDAVSQTGCSQEVEQQASTVLVMPHLNLWQSPRRCRYQT